MLDQEKRLEMQRQKALAVIRREKLLEKARALINRQKLRGYMFRDGTGAFLIMRPETAHFLLGTRPFDPVHGRQLDDDVNIDGTPVIFSEELEADQIILALEYWPEWEPE